MTPYHLFGSGGKKGNRPFCVVFVTCLLLLFQTHLFNFSFCAPLKPLLSVQIYCVRYYIWKKKIVTAEKVAMEPLRPCNLCMPLIILLEQTSLAVGDVKKVNDMAVLKKVELQVCDNLFEFKVLLLW